MSILYLQNYLFLLNNKINNKQTFKNAICSKKILLIFICLFYLFINVPFAFEFK